MDRTYLCIDLKTFYASVECVERGLDPLKEKLIVADKSRGDGTICLAVSTGLKKLGVKNRCRVFEIPKNIKYITAKPRMKLYIEYSANIYATYLKYIDKDDIHVYSIDECFIDATKYLKLYKMNAYELSKMLIDDVYKTYGITATAGIGPNLFLAKIAMDILAKHINTNIATLDIKTYKEKLWNHTPLTDFWQIGTGISNRLKKYNITTMEGISKCDPKILYKEFGVNAEILIDHANGIEPTTIEEIKKYKSKSNSLCFGQVLFEDYNFSEARLVIKEMVELACLDLVDKHLVTNNLYLFVGYSKNELEKPLSISKKMIETTNSYKIINEYFLQMYDENIKRDKWIRRISLGFNSVVDEIYKSNDLFTDNIKEEKEHNIQEAILQIKKKYGKNSIIKGMNLEEKATTIKRNKLIGGHNEE